MNRRSARSAVKFALVKAAAGVGVAVTLRALAHQRRWIEFRDKVVLITGGSRGLGLALARRLAEQGARIAICARDDDELARAEGILRRIRPDVQVATFRASVTDEAQVADLIQRVVGRFGTIDVLINNAGTISVGPMDSQTVQDYRDAMDLHFWAPLYTTMAALPVMRARGGGRIVNISSIGGKIAAPHLLPYSASKFALAGLSQGLRSELTRSNIFVTGVFPGLMRTGSPRNATFKGKHRAEFAWFAIGDSLPGLSINVDRAADEILLACQRGQAEIVVSLPAKIAVKFQSLFPELTADINSIISRLLPGPGGIGAHRALGSDSESFVAPSFLTTLTERAAIANNEMTTTTGNSSGARTR